MGQVEVWESEVLGLVSELVEAVLELAVGLESLAEAVAQGLGSYLVQAGSGLSSRQIPYVYLVI